MFHCPQRTLSKPPEITRTTEKSGRFGSACSVVDVKLIENFPVDSVCSVVDVQYNFENE